MPDRPMHDEHSAKADPRSYEVLGEIATGGMATVYLGRLRRSLGFARLVAIKCMHPQYARDPSFASMFVDEARLTARLRHPNVVSTLDIVEGDGQLLLVMDYVEGETLSSLLRAVTVAEADVPARIASAIVHDVLLGLHEAHEALDDEGQPLGIIHRDVSPQNVMIGIDGMARVLDFGVAKAKSRVHHSDDGEIKGKLPYMPPEQLFGEAIDRRVDVYAAGVLLWEALTKKRLFEGPSEEILVRQIAEAPIAPPSTIVESVPAALDAVVLRALARDPAARFATALEMAEAIAAAIALPTKNEIASWVKPFTKPRVSTPPPSNVDLLKAVPDAQAVEAALERATRVSRPSERAPAAGERPSRRARSTGAISVVAGFGVGAVLVGLVATSLAHASPNVQRAARIAEETKSPLVLRPATMDDDVAIVVAPTPRPTIAKARPLPVREIDTKRERESCRLPYVFDAEGRRHYKVECL